MTTPRILAIMGSGETAPTMVSTHRSLVSRLTKPVSATVIDTPYGFQENASELAERAVKYFSTSVNIDIAVAGLRRLAGDGLDPVEIERGLRRIADADYVFAGPGSPTYALRQWAGSPVHAMLADKLRDGGIVTFASAAALTLGSHTVPVYEIYKVGEEPRWEQGLDLLGDIGIRTAVIPHFDNAEGGHHDTRFCYLGERRLAALERDLPDDHYVLGIDEHTAIVIDLDAGVATVTGNGSVTLRMRADTLVFPTGSHIDLAVLRDPWAGGSGAAERSSSGHPEREPQEDGVPIDAEHRDTSLGGAARRCKDMFDVAMEAADASAAVRAIFALMHAIDEWAADTTQSDDLDNARAHLRLMISALGDAAVGGLRDERDVVAPYVEAILDVRSTVRAEKRYDLSDVIRDHFVRLGVEIRDTADGVEWHLGNR